jgi:hypothetical protein
VLTGCWFTAHTGYAVVIRNDSSRGYVVVVKNGLSEWSYAAPANTVSEIPGETWNAGIDLQLRSTSCELVKTFPVPGDGFYLVAIPSSGEPSIATTKDPPNGIVQQQSQQCTGES